MLARDKVRRQNIRPPSRYEDANLVAYALSVADDIEKEELKSYQEGQRSRDKRLWNNASDDEMDSLRRNHTWDLIEKPKRQKTVGCKWLYKYKLGIPGVEDRRHKTRLVAKGYSQKEGIYYNEIFSPVVKHVSIRIMIYIVVNRDYELE